MCRGVSLVPVPYKSTETSGCTASGHLGTVAPVLDDALGPADRLPEVALGKAEVVRRDLDGIAVLATRHAHLREVKHRLVDHPVEPVLALGDGHVLIEGVHDDERDEGRQRDDGRRTARTPVVARLAGAHSVSLSDGDERCAGRAGVVGH